MARMPDRMASTRLAQATTDLFPHRAHMECGHCRPAPYALYARYGLPYAVPCTMARMPDRMASTRLAQASMTIVRSGSESDSATTTQSRVALWVAFGRRIVSEACGPVRL